jgi:hypothetical protein
MNPILERFDQLDHRKLSADSALMLVHQGHYIFFQTVPRKLRQLPQQLFALDVDQRKLVLDMIGTEAKSLHRKLDLDAIESFYTRHEVQGDSSQDFLYVVTQQQEELEVSSRFWASTRDIEEMAMVLGVLCNKPVWRRPKHGDAVRLPTAGMLNGTDVIS